MVYPHRHPPARPTLNAVAFPLTCDPARETAEDRTARHLRTCQELIDLGMMLSRAAAERAMADMVAPPPSTAIPCSAAAALEQSEARARPRIHYGLVFARLSRAVRQTVALQAHIADGTLTKRRTCMPDPHPPRQAAPSTAEPGRPDHGRDRLERPDWTLPGSPDGRLPVEDLIQAIWAELGLIAGSIDLPPPPDPGPCRSTHPHEPTSALPTRTRHPPPARERSG